MEPRFFESQAEFRAWLEANHASERELWLGFFKKSSGKDGLTYREALDEALCFGWIDGLARSIDRDARAQRWTPRRKRSVWSNVNVKRYEELDSAGRVAPAGRAAFEARTEAATGIYSFEQAKVDLGADYEAALMAEPAAWAYWSSCPPGYQRTATWWVVSAKREETRLKRLAELIECSREGVRIPLLRRPGPEK